MNYAPELHEFKALGEPQRQPADCLCILHAPFSRRRLLGQISRLTPRRKLLRALPIALPPARQTPRGQPQALAARAQFAGLCRMFRRNSAPVAVVWNGYSGRRALYVAAARATDTPVLFLEQSPIPNRLQIDWQGVNYHHSARCALEQLAGTSFSGGPDASWRQQSRHLRALKPRLRTGIDQLIPDELRQKNPFIFIPLQVSHDTQVTRFGGWIRSMDHLLEEVTIASAALPENWTIIAKPHPRSRRDEIQRLLQFQTDRLKFDLTTDTFHLVRQSRAVLTLNSSVGLQAFYFDKPVITLGHSLYDVEPAVTKADTATKLRQCLANIATIGFDPDLRGAIMTELTQNTLFELAPDGSGILTPSALAKLSAMLNRPLGA